MNFDSIVFFFSTYAIGVSLAVSDNCIRYIKALVWLAANIV